ncbi:MAG: hypothetical protein AAGE85_09155 [Pseudomonadota bacterium]
MPDKQLIVVHGMGTHDEASVVAEVEQTLQTVFSRYESIKDESPTDKFDITAVAYDSFFEDYRQAVADRDDVLAALTSVSGDFPFLPRAAAEVAALDRSLTEDRFFSTHWLDVLLYRFTLMSEPIRLKLAEVIAQAVADRGSANVHVLGHSLGTSVVHDTLAKLYGPEPGPAKLSNVRDRLGGVHQVANVSRLLQSFRKVGSSEVRPGTGCCSVFYEYRHMLDPFPRFKPFDPTDNGEWVSHSAWQSSYRLVRPTGVTGANVHGLDHYLLNPMVHLPLLKLLFGFRPLKDERDAAHDAYVATTVRGSAIAVREAFESFNFSETSIGNLIAAGKALKDMVESLGEEFQ